MALNSWVSRFAVTSSSLRLTWMSGVIPVLSMPTRFGVSQRATVTYRAPRSSLSFCPRFTCGRWDGEKAVLAVGIALLALVL